MAVEKDGKTRWLGIPGMVLGICICMTVLLVAKVVEDGHRQDRITDKEWHDIVDRVGAMEPKLDMQAGVDERHDREIKSLQAEVLKLSSRNTPRPGSVAP